MSQSSTAKNTFAVHTSARAHPTAFPLKWHHQILPTRTFPGNMGLDSQDRPGNGRNYSRKAKKRRKTIWSQKLLLVGLPPSSLTSPYL